MTSCKKVVNVRRKLNKDLKAYDLETIRKCRHCKTKGPLEAMIALPETEHCLRPVYHCPECCETSLAVHQVTWLDKMFNQNIREVFRGK